VPRSPVRARGGGGAAHGNRGRRSSESQEPARAAQPRPGLRAQGPRHPWAWRDAAPEGLQRAGCRRIPSRSRAPSGAPALLPCPRQDWGPRQDRVTCAQGRDSSRPWMRQAGQRWALARRVGQAGPRRWPGRMRPEAQPGRGGTGPLAGRGAALLARGAVAVARGCPGTRAQAAGRDASRHAGATVARGDGVAPPEAAARAATGPGVAQSQGRRRVGRGGGQEGACQRLAPCGLRGEEREGDCQGLGDRGSVQARGHAGPLGGGGDRCATRGAVVWTVRRRDLGQARRALTPQVGAAPPEGPGGAPLGRLAIGVRPPAAAQADSHLL